MRWVLAAGTDKWYEYSNGGQGVNELHETGNLFKLLGEHRS